MAFLRYLIASILPISDQLTARVIFTMVFVAMESRDIKYFYLTIGVAIASVIVSSVLYIVSRLMRIGFMRDVLLEIRKKAFDKVLSVSYKDFSKQSKDTYISHLVNDINTFENNFFDNLVNVIYLLGSYIVSALVVLVMHPLLGVVMILISWGVYGLGQFFGRKTEEMQMEVTTCNEALTIQAANTFNGLEILKLSGVEDRFLYKNMGTISKVENRKLGLSIYTQFQSEFMRAISYVILTVLLMFMMYNVLNGESFGREMLVFQFAQGMIFPFVEMVPRINVIIQGYRKMAKTYLVDRGKGYL